MDRGTYEDYFRQGKEKRFVPTNHQVLPRITKYGKIPESRAGWQDNYMTRPEKNVVTPGVCTFVRLQDQHANATSCSSPIGDGLMCYFCFETQVAPSGVSTDQLLNSYGGVFYQEAVELTHLLLLNPCRWRK
jgi:hypothetical protein